MVKILNTPLPPLLLSVHTPLLQHPNPRFSSPLANIAPPLYIFMDICEPVLTSCTLPGPPILPPFQSYFLTNLFRIFFLIFSRSRLYTCKLLDQAIEVFSSLYRTRRHDFKWSFTALLFKPLSDQYCGRYILV